MTTDVTKIITLYLDKMGFDGLYDDNECGCLKNDLAPCGGGEIPGHCKPGYKLVAPPDAEFDYVIGPSRDESED